MGMKRILAASFVVVTLSIVGVVWTQSSKAPKRPAAPLTNDDILKLVKKSSESAESTGGTAAASAINWQESLEDGLSRAADGGKILVVDVYTDWCGWCKKMDETVYQSPRIAALQDQVVFVKLNAEDGSEGEDFARRSRVQGYPTTIMLDSNGSEIGRHVGYIPSPELFAAFVREGVRK